MMVKTKIEFRRCFECPENCSLDDLRNWLEGELSTDVEMEDLRSKVFKKDIVETYGISTPSIVDSGTEEVSDFEKDGKISRKRTEVEELKWKCYGWGMGDLCHEWPNLVSGFIKVTKRTEDLFRS